MATQFSNLEGEPKQEEVRKPRERVKPGRRINTWN
jgi:hypothetical protein